MRDSYEYYSDIFQGREMPLGFIDLNSLDKNIDDIDDRCGDKELRVASKSIRSVSALEYILGRSEKARGVMCYTGREAGYLAERDFEDLLIAYPLWHREEIEAGLKGKEHGAEVVFMADSEEHVDRVAGIAEEMGVEAGICIDLDMSAKYPGIHFGVMRSGVREPSDSEELADYIAAESSVYLSGLMGYEAQIAGLCDRSPANNAAMNTVIRYLKRNSWPKVRRRRENSVERIQSEHSLDFVNGGGTGSIEKTITDDSVTEVTSGSGFYASALFDHYDDFQHEPAAGYALEVTRMPEKDIYTCRGGGYIASGPTGIDKQPVIQLPRDAELLKFEGAGEVQTPVRYSGDLEIGDPVVMRHSKAGEICEHFNKMLMIQDGDVFEVVSTYRGDGKAFL